MNMSDSPNKENLSLNGGGITIAIDAMGGDNAPESVLLGAEKAAKKHPKAKFLLFGDKSQISPVLDKCKKLKSRCEIHHTSEFIAANDKPSNALRRGRNSSMYLAIKAVKDGIADCTVSGGNTGALMAFSKFSLGTLPGIDRPAIGGLMPHVNGYSVMLDLGANVHCDAENLFEFSIMGEAFCRAVLGIEKPSIGLLNVGSEKNKGHEVLRTTINLIEESDLDLNFHGYIEGNDIGAGTVDVIVTDGFTGNIALKTVEGTAKFLIKTLKKGLTRSPLGLAGMSIALPTLLGIKKKAEPQNYNGAMFLGLNGIIVKSHGGSDAPGVANAIDVAHKLAKNKINDHITEEMISSGHVPPKDIIDEDDISID